MRTIIYAIYDTTTREKVYVSTKLCSILRKMEELGNDERYNIRHTWKSF